MNYTESTAFFLGVLFAAYLLVSYTDFLWK